MQKNNIKNHIDFQRNKNVHIELKLEIWCEFDIDVRSRELMWPTLFRIGLFSIFRGITFHATILSLVSPNLPMDIELWTHVDIKQQPTIEEHKIQSFTTY